MKKKIVAFISFFILIVIMCIVVMFFKTESIIKNDEKIQIVATLFPQYDFASKIVGDKADVKLLLDSGIEAHNYEPTAKDMITILNNSDIFLFNGIELEPWTENIVENLKNTNCDIVNVSENIELIKIEDFEKRHINSEILKEEHEEEHNGHEEIYDEHIWMNPENAIIMIDNILEELCKLENVVDNAQRKEIAVGGEFAYAYLIDAYNINFVSVYNNCGEGEDPSIAKVKSVIDYINKYNIPVVYYEELTEGTVAKMIAEETKAKPMVLYSIHNGNPEDDSYISLMEKNIEALKEGLK